MSAQTVPLRALAHGRAGDKGNSLNVSVIAFDPAHFDYLVTHVTEDFCRRAFINHSPGRLTRYVLPQLSAMNFVIEDVLGGGVNLSLSLDRHGKSLSFLLLDSELTAPAGWSA
ncbi:hypothetical protein [uncultured Sulfitobacter sp.]|uniref:AtuA-related protein n=1 Tax=uncultured Sulfitobacter sp. TaxID=191468 RepID=UPI00259AAF82|nr:hypothetical protein [uncultured Sulfitobacter sp.]